MTNANPISAEQEPKDDKLFFTTTVMDPNPRNAMRSLIVSVQTCPIKGLTPYNTIEELLQTLPRNDKKYTVQELNKFIARDCMRGFGEVYEDFGVVAYSGKNMFDRPIAMVTNPDGSKVFYASPNIEKMVKVI